LSACVCVCVFSERLGVGVDVNTRVWLPCYPF